MKNYKYVSAKEDLLERVKQMEPGERLPNRNALSEELGIARTTLEHAISNLIAQGWLSSRRGSGTYATARKEYNAIIDDSLTQWGDVTSKIVKNQDSWALLVTDIVHDIAPLLLRGIEDFAQSHGIRLIICNTDDELKKQNDYLYQLTKSGVSGILTMPGIVSNSDPRVWQAARECGVQVVSCVRPIMGFSCPGVHVNSHQSGFLATKHLLDIGCQRIAMITGPLYSTMYDRYHGYRTALAEANITPDPALFSYESSRDAIHQGIMPNAKALIQQKNFDGIFVFNDRMARVVFQLLQENGMQPGKDVAVVSCDDTELCTNLMPQLSSVHMPIYDIGAKAAELLFAMCSGKAPASELTVFDCALSLRQSTLGFKPKNAL